MALSLVSVGVAVAGGVYVMKKNGQKTMKVVEDDDSDDENDVLSAEADPSLPPPVTNKEYSKEEIEKHNSKGDCWIIVGGKVYDATTYLERHPGGGYSIYSLAGTDTSEDYNAIHSSRANDILAKHQIGIVK